MWFIYRYVKHSIYYKVYICYILPSQSLWIIAIVKVKKLARALTMKTLHLLVASQVPLPPEILRCMCGREAGGLKQRGCGAGGAGYGPSRLESSCTRPLRQVSLTSPMCVAQRPMAWIVAATKSLSMLLMYVCEHNKKVHWIRHTGTKTVSQTMTESVARSA